jgi:hypothetical protein
MANYLQGHFHPKNLEKYIGDKSQIIFRSGWERQFMSWCDSNPAVILWTSEYPIQYYSQVDEKVRRYFVDFFVRVRGRDNTEKTLMVEIKPASQTVPPKKPRINNPKNNHRYIEACKTFQVNQDKWNAAKTYADKNGFVFTTLNEYDLGIKKRD